MTSADTTAPKPAPEPSSTGPTGPTGPIGPTGSTGRDRPSPPKAARPGAAGVSAAESRADRFVREVTALKIPDPAAARNQLWLRTGIALMVLGLALGAIAYGMSHGTSDQLVQNDAITVGLLGVGSCVVGSAVFLRFSLTGFLRFWMARQSFDIASLADRLLERGIRDLTDNDPASR